MPVEEGKGRFTSYLVFRAFPKKKYGRTSSVKLLHYCMISFMGAGKGRRGGSGILTIALFLLFYLFF